MSVTKMPALVRLQWGHGTVTVENSVRGQRNGRQRHQLQWGHGTVTVENRPHGQRQGRRRRNFNGATAR